MNDLLEKVKSLDKRVLIGVGIAIAVVIIILIAFVIGGNKPANGDNTQGGTQIDSEFGSEVISGTENLGETESLGTETESELGTEVESEVETETESNDGQQTVTTNPEGEEIIGAGSKDQPYKEILNADTMSVKTVSVPAGKTLYYEIQRVGGLWLSIEDADAYVIEADGTRHNAKNGKVSFTVDNALASDYVTLQIGNNGSSSKSFTIKFANIKGTYQNPEKISKIGEYKISLSAGKEAGYYYKYTAEKDGVIRFYVEGTVSSTMVVTNKRTSAQRTFKDDYYTDANGVKYIEVEVQKGDELMIQVSANPDRKWQYPATDITWKGVYQ